MQEPEMPDDEFKIPLSDITKVIQKNKKKILFSSIAAALLFGTYSLFQPILYLGEATFKEKSNSQGSVNSSAIASFLLSGLNTHSQSEAKTMMSSRKLLEEVVKTLNMQATLSELGLNEGWLARPFQNLAVEYNSFRKRPKYPLSDRTSLVKATKIVYLDELPCTISILFDSDNTYQIFDAEEKKLGTGALDIPFTNPKFAFTLSKTEAGKLEGKTFYLTFLPLSETAKSLSDCIKVSPDKEDSSLLKLTYKNRDRHVACEVLNQLMAAYQNYLRSEQEKISSEQISYLNQRENEIGANLDSMVQDYASRVSSDLSSVGYINSEKGLDFLATQLQKYKEKMLFTDLMLKRLTRVLDEDPETQLDAFLQGGHNPEHLNLLVSDILRLKQECVCLELAIRERGWEKKEGWQASFAEQLAEIGEMRENAKETSQLIAQLENGMIPQKPVSLQEKKYMIVPWIEQLQEIETGWKKTSNSQEKEKNREEWLHVREQFVTYLYNLKHFLEMRERSIRERLSHQQSSQADFQGINLETANKLYLGYVQQQSELESQILQYDFLIDELKNPILEISSLSSLITDEVTSRLIENASKLVLSLQDDANRSAKEKERMKAELEIERKFLAIHLKQTIDLLSLNIGLIKDKIYSLQNATLELLREQMTLLEKQLTDSIRTHIRNMREERKLIVSNERELKQEMASLPQKWAAEKMIEQKLKLNATMVEEVAKLVESKNIASNLEMIQSAPVDSAIPKIYPERPQILFYALIGGLLGTIITTSLLLGVSIAKGFPVSKESLELAGLHVSGGLSLNKETNRSTYHHLCRFLNQRFSPPLTLLFAGGGTCLAGEELSLILNGRCGSVLLLKEGRQNSETGQKEILLPPRWLFGKPEDFPIATGDHFSELSLGISICDLLIHVPYDQLRNIFLALKTLYPIIIAEADAPIERVEEMVSLFDCSAIVLSDKTPMVKIKPFIQTLKDEGKIPVTTFIIKED